MEVKKYLTLNGADVIMIVGKGVLATIWMRDPIRFGEIPINALWDVRIVVEGDHVILLKRMIVRS